MEITEIAMRGLLTMIVCLTATPAFAAKIVLVAGGGDGKDGSPATAAKIITPFGCDFDSKGRLYLVEFEKGERVRMIDEDGKLKTIAGTGKKGSPVKTKSPLESTFNGLHGITIHRQKENDQLFLADTWNKCIPTMDLQTREMGGTGGITGLTQGFSKTPLTFQSVFCVSIDQNRMRLIITDLDRHQIYSWSVDGWIEECILAGNGKKGTPTNGKKALDEPLLDPRAAAMDKDGNLYILERSGHCLRVVDKDGIIKTVMGTGKAGTAVGKALESQMNGPKHLCIDKDGSVIIADSENHRILRYIPKEEKVTVIAGTGKKGSAGLDGDPLKCELNRPHGVCVHPKTGELYICDSYNDRILKIVP